MVDFISSNFEEHLPTFLHQLKKCSFVAIDCEFSTLPYGQTSNKSFLESGEERYQKIRESINQCLPIQVGLVPFTYNKDMAQYKATVYKFNIFPKYYGSEDKNIYFSASSIQFLRDNNFDFNKAFYDGLSFMNHSECQWFTEEINRGTLQERIFSSLTFDDREQVACHHDAVNKWLHCNSVGSELKIQIESNSPHLKYFLHKEFRKNFKNAWTYQKGMDSPELVLKHVSEEERIKLDETSDSLEDELMKSLKGFSHVMDAIIDAKKPLVGHNLLLDLLSCYHHFYRDLPVTYCDFKKEFLHLFPIVYDTKFISGEMKRNEFKKVFNNIALGNLYVMLREMNSSYCQVRMEGGSFNDGSESYHDAAWDAYITGFCFVKLIVLKRLAERGEIPVDQENCLKPENLSKNFGKNLSNAEILLTARQFKNKINMAFAATSHVNLEGKDPTSTRPPVIVISSVKKDRLDVKLISSTLSGIGKFEVVPLSQYSASVAFANYPSYHATLRRFRKMNEFKVEQFSLLKHHKLFRSLFLATSLIPVAAVACYFYLKK